MGGTGEKIHHHDRPRLDKNTAIFAKDRVWQCTCGQKFYPVGTVWNTVRDDQQLDKDGETAQ